MIKTDKIWKDGKFINWDDCKIHALTYALHYGVAAFEGIRFYDTDNGVAIFRLKDHIKRLVNSAKIIDMGVKYTEEELVEIAKETVRVNNVKAGYMRPIIWYGYGSLFLDPEKMVTEHMIAVWPWGKYLGNEAIKVKSSRYIRPHPKSLPMSAKISGYYVNSVLSTIEARKDGFTEALLLDYKGNVAEGPGENFFIVKNNRLLTPSLGSILPGITRESVIGIARDEGIKVEEKSFKLNYAKSADEAFFTGTAAEITPISQIDTAIIGNGKIGQITAKLKKIFEDTISGKNKKYEKWLDYV